MDNPQTAIIPAQLDARAVAEWAKLIQQSIVEIRKTVLHEGSDYGKIPGTNKDVLLKPGAEKMSSAFKLYPVPKLLTCVEDWKDGFFFYRYQIDMMHRETGEVWGSGIGSCNSREKKYAWRWVTESELPAGMDKETRDNLVKEDKVQTLTEFAFAVNKAETTGQWAKSAEYWQMFKDAIASGTAKKVQKEIKNGEKRDAWELTTGVVKYRLPNEEICDLVNTIDKMAYKRAYVAAVLIATNASEFFTQDMEDFMSLALPEEDNIVEGVIVEVTPPPAAAQPAVVENRKPTPVPSTLTHFSDFPDKRQYVVNLAIENLFLETGDTWEDLLLLCDLTAETVRNIATGQELGKLVEAKAMELFRKEHPDAGKPPAALPAKNGFVIVSEAVCLDGKAEFVADVGKLTVSRKRLIEMLEAGDVHEQFNGKAQIDAMNLREWGENGTALADCSHSFPPLKLVYRVDNGGNGGVVLVVTDAQPVTDWRNKTVDVKPDADAEKQAARELDEIPF